MDRVWKRALLGAIVCVGVAVPVHAQGFWEIGAHAGTWSLNLLRSPIEDALGDALQEVVQDRLQEDFPDKGLGSYRQAVRFDSSGHNVGFGVRFYPGGADGLFSLGLSLERTEMRLQVQADVRQDFQDGSVLDASAAGEILLRPWTFHFSLRWEIPLYWIRPYITLGFGYSGLTGTVTASGVGTLQDARFPIPLPYAFAKEEPIADIEDLPLRWIPFVELSLGLKVRLVHGLYGLVDAGVWNGLRFRGGLALRF